MTGTPQPRRRWPFFILIVVLLIGGYTIIAAQSPLRIDDTYVSASTVTGVDDGYLVAYTPSGDVQLHLHLINNGRLPVRLTGIVAPWVPTSDPMTSGPIAPFYKASPVLFDGEQPVAFHPVSLAPGETVSAGPRLTMCPAGTPGTDDGRFTAYGIELVYRYAGWQRTHMVDLSQPVAAPFYKCDYAGNHR
jgi:hypothetical protein